jgi:uncharacterized membrane protein
MPLVGRRFVPGEDAVERLRALALHAGGALCLVGFGIPMQLDRQWVLIAWSLLALGTWMVFERLPHRALRLLGAVLYALAGGRLLLDRSVVLYEERGMPILNWLLYTWGVPAAACFVGAHVLNRAEGGARAREAGVRPSSFGSGAGLLGVLLLFALVNYEVAQYFSPGRYVELVGEHDYARDLALSFGWGLYAIALLAVGIWRGLPALRQVSLGFLLLAVGKVFVYDLKMLSGLYRVLSFLGLGAGLILVSLFYQRFVFRRGREAATEAAPGGEAPGP